jgi:hypothetical protein
LTVTVPDWFLRIAPIMDRLHMLPSTRIRPHRSKPVSRCFLLPAALNVFPSLRRFHSSTTAFQSASSRSGSQFPRMYFPAASFSATIGVVNLSLPEPTRKHCTAATTSLERGLAIRGPDMTRSKAFELTALATSHLVEGDLDQGAAVGQQAVDLAEQLRSVRVADRLAPLEEAARMRGHHRDVQDLAERIATLRSG